MPSAITIRRVLPEEWKLWRDVRLRMLRDDADFFSSRYEDAVRDPDERWRAWVAATADESSQRALFCADPGDGPWLGVVGAFVRVDPSEAQLISMWVSPDARGSGIAKRLIAAVGDWAGAQGCRDVVLFVQEANQPAHRVYRQLGFEATGDRAPIGGGRTGFKLVLRAPAAHLSSFTTKETP
ncbi:MAG: N-acetyltransferase family protein [Gaiella sp.]